MWPQFGYSPVEIASAWLQGARLTAYWPQLQDREVILTHLTRVGIALMCRLFRLERDDEVLVPAYNCGSEIDPLLWYGLRPVLYRVDANAWIDPDDLRRRVTAKTRLVYVTHFFGWPQQLTELAVWCRQHDLILIEDCAHSLFSEGPEGPTGMTGDAALYCPRKTMPLPDGGILTLKHGLHSGSARLAAPGLGRVFRELRPFLKNWLCDLGLGHLRSFWNSGRSPDGAIPDRSQIDNDTCRPTIPANCYFDRKIEDRGISRISRGIVNRCDPQAIMRQRRHNYLKLYENINDLPGLQPLYDDLPEGICPLVLPVLVQQPLLWLQLLTRHGVYPLTWWRGYHPRLSWEGFPEARKLKDHMLAFPVHQYLADSHLEQTIDGIGQASRELRSTVKAAT